MKNAECLRQARAALAGKTAMIGQAPETISAPPGLEVFAAIDQRALDAIPTGFCVCRADSSLVRYNRRAVQLWGRALPLGAAREQHGDAFRRYRPDGEEICFSETPVARAMRSGEPVV